MASIEMISDTELLEEVSAFLTTTDVVLTRTPRADGGSIPGSWASADSDESESSTSKATDDAAALKHKNRREKEIIRKQRYQRRLKQERETLRQMEKTLTARLLRVKRMKHAHQTEGDASDANVIQLDFALRDFAKHEREERFRAEQEQKRLVEAVCTQASYLATLKGLFPDQKASCAKISRGNKKIAQTLGPLEF
ncbi:hypothetical protein L915_13087 [Phytophthora nicotianae]|uniref:Uncharacterized protein n=1 Tax=Phytophthora nicotianae TaxID=4792 RepID=W2GEM5_PHYNI|nr:hypothetical protein L915_13087 [Phytophthora nicotianae]